MSNRGLDYGFLMERAMHSVVHAALTHAAETGLPGKHHFYISFLTGADGVELSNRLKMQYPEEMTIVVQHQYWNLHVHDAAFEIELAFSGKRERLFIPFAALTGFADPEAKFGLKFGADAAAGMQHNQDAAAVKDAAGTESSPKDAPKDASKGGEKIVSLDQFRNK